MVLEVTAKTDTDALIEVGKKEYWEIGYDLDGKQRMGSWLIKEIVDLSLQPGKTLTERFIKEFPQGTTNADIEIKVSLWPDPKTELIAERVVKKISFERRP